MNFDTTLSLILGVSATGIGSVLFATAIYLMARHAMLLFAGVRIAKTAAGEPRRYIYSFFIQNVEDVPYPGPLELRIVSGGSSDSIQRKDISVHAGPKRIDFESFVSRRENDYTCARLTFDSVPSYDTWLIECTSSATSLKVRIVTPDPGTWLRRRLIIDLWPREISLDAVSAQRVSVGGSLTPRTLMLTLIALGSVAVYLGIILWARHDKGASELFGPLGRTDALILGLLLLVLWQAFRWIQRPIYPIMQGYLDPSDLTELKEDGAGNTESAATVDAEQ